MNRNSHNLKGFSVNSPPRWRTVFIALALALVTGSVGQTVPAQAQDEDVEYHYLVDVINPPYQFCIDETREFLVRILASGSIGPNDPIEKASITLGGGTTITGDLADSSIVDFTTARTMLINSPSPSLIRPGIVVFTVKANKVGKTTITFTADVAEFGNTFKAKSFSVDVEVINCKYKVTTNSQMSWSGPYGSIEFRGLNVEGQVKADEAGIFTGTAAVIWLSTSAIPNCVAVNTLGESQVNMQGALNESGQLVLELNYDSVAYGEVISCPGGRGGSNEILSASPLKITVPSSGGVVQLSQQMEGPMIALGSANVYVIPQEDEAAVFIPGDHQASWDHFSSLFGILLALHK